MDNPVTIYRTQLCVYCAMAARLLTRLGIGYTEIYLDGKPDERAALQERTDWSTVPQVFIGERFVGGYTELAKLAETGDLEALRMVP